MKNILCFGDSNTYGYIPGNRGRYDYEVRWTGILNERAREHGYRVIEEGLVGRTTIFEDPLRDGRRGVEVLPIILETHNPIDKIVLMLGTNDCKTLYGATAGVIGLGIRKLLEQIRRTSPDAKILLVSPIHLGERVWEEGFDTEFSKNSVGVSKELGDVYESIASEYNIEFLKASDYAKPSEEDQEHMNEEGHASFANAVYNKLFVR